MRTLAEQAEIELAYRRMQRLYANGGRSDIALLLAEIAHLRALLDAAYAQRDELSKRLLGAYAASSRLEAELAELTALWRAGQD